MESTGMVNFEVIVQGIPSNADSGAKVKRKLERALRKFGPVECSYVWTNGGDGCLQVENADNFARLSFRKLDDSVRACHSADMRQLKYNNSNLILTPVPNELVPIANLSDDCVIRIFSNLDPEERLKIEEVSPQWQELAPYSWSNTTKLDLTSHTITRRNFESILSRCGKYLKEFVGNMEGMISPDLIDTYCEKLESLTLTIKAEASNVDCWQRALAKLLEKLKGLKSFKLCHNFNTGWNFLSPLPDTLERLSVTAHGTTLERISNLDFAKFHDLQELSIHHYSISTMEGFQGMAKLTHLDFSPCFVTADGIRSIEHLSRLKTLILSGPINLDNDMLLRLVRLLRGLECLSITGQHRITDDSLVSVTSLPHLKILNMSYLAQITFSTLNEMSSLEKMECTFLKKVRDDGLIRLLNVAPNLRYLDMSGCSNSTDFFAAADAVMKTRPSNTPLKIVTDTYTALLDLTQYLPQLVIESSLVMPDPHPYRARSYYRSFCVSYVFCCISCICFCFALVPFPEDIITNIVLHVCILLGISIGARVIYSKFLTS